jgi:hypothetical protein
VNIKAKNSQKYSLLYNNIIMVTKRFYSEKDINDHYINNLAQYVGYDEKERVLLDMVKSELIENYDSIFLFMKEKYAE